MGLYYLQSRYYDPEIGRFLNADAFVSTGQGELGNNMFAYCCNNPVTYYDPSGNSHMVAGVEDEGSFLDSLQQYIGAGGGAIKASLGSLIGAVAVVIHVYDVAQMNAFIARKKGKTARNPKTPEVQYPGNDPSQPPGDDFEWRGKEPKGGEYGAWVNPKTGEKWHPDLNHGGEIGPHWDYNYMGSGCDGWRVYANGDVILKIIGIIISIFEFGGWRQ